VSAGTAETAAGLLLLREPSGERFLKITFLRADTGVALFLLRRSSKPAAAAPDLFDSAEIELAPPRPGAAAGVRFANEYRVLRRRRRLAADYERLELACRLARIVAANPLPPESAPAILALLENALGAFETRPRPDAALLKTLWRLAGGEGLPVREHWLPSLNAADAAATAAILRTPLDRQTEDAARVSRLRASLEHWLAAECHFVIP